MMDTLSTAGSFPSTALGAGGLAFRHEASGPQDSALSTTAQAMLLPSLPITVRQGTMDDLPFIDGLQKIHTKQVGWMPTKQFEGKIKAGHVLIAEGRRHGPERNARSPGTRQEEGERHEARRQEDGPASTLASCHLPGASLLGYLIGNDQHFKRDDVGIIYQINVVPGVQRGLIGATLLKAQFERSAWGCKLYCCWCAQDIAANHFWQAMGFVPLAFRTGGLKRGKRHAAKRQEEASGPDSCLGSERSARARASVPSARIHIFWQKRIRAGDEQTPWWFPSQTTGGAIRSDRIVLPIPQGVRWWDEMPRVLPGVSEIEPPANPADAEAQALASPRKRKTKPEAALPVAPAVRRSLGQKIAGWGAKVPVAPEPVPASAAVAENPPPAESPKPRRKQQKNDPKIVAAARELRDRWLEAANRGECVALPRAKYDVARIPAPMSPTKLLAA